MSNTDLDNLRNNINRQIAELNNMRVRQSQQKVILDKAIKSRDSSMKKLSQMQTIIANNKTLTVDEQTKYKSDISRIVRQMVIENNNVVQQQNNFNKINTDIDNKVTTIKTLQKMQTELENAIKTNANIKIESVMVQNSNTSNKTSNTAVASSKAAVTSATRSVATEVPINMSPELQKAFDKTEAFRAQYMAAMANLDIITSVRTDAENKLSNATNNLEPNIIKQIEKNNFNKTLAKNMLISYQASLFILNINLQNIKLNELQYRLYTNNIYINLIKAGIAEADLGSSRPINKAEGAKKIIELDNNSKTYMTSINELKSTIAQLNKNLDQMMGTDISTSNVTSDTQASSNTPVVNTNIATINTSPIESSAVEQNPNINAFTNTGTSGYSFNYNYNAGRF